MELEQIILSPRVEEELYRFAKLLYDEKYFSFQENADRYVSDLYDFIYTIPNQKRFATKHTRYGKYDVRYKANKHTSYFITFDVDGKRFLIKNIITNYTPDYPRYIGGNK